MRSSIASACGAAAILAFAGAAAAQELYFTEYQFNNPKIKAIGFDGSNLRELFTIPAQYWLPLGLVVNPATGRVFWSDSTFPTHDILTAGISGVPAPVSVINVAGNASRGASLDAMGRIYFTVDNTIRRVNADGTGLVTLITTPDAGTIGAPFVDATNGHVYFPYARQIRRMDLDGTNVKTVVRGSSYPRSIQVDVAANAIYWIDADTISDFVGRARLDGSEFTVLHDLTPSVVQSSGLIDLVLDPVGGKLYFADELVGVIYSTNLDGSGLSLFYSSPSGLTPSGLALSTGAPAQAVADCNGNAIPDSQDIAAATSLDCNDNGVPDECETRACPDDVLLLDTGSNAASSQGRALGWPSSWEQFQPFDVPAGGWQVGQVGLDGYTTNYHDGTGFAVSLWPDDGSGNVPDENGAPIAEATNVNFRFDTDNENWVYADLEADLAPGRYWLRLRATDPLVYAGTVNSGFNGLPSRFRGTSGVLQTAAGPLAVRILEGGSDCLADFDGNGLREVPDIFAFLSAWFAQDPRADVDGAPGITVPDIFFFLSAWFAGC